MTKPADDDRKQPETKPPRGPRTPYPVDHPGTSKQPGAEPDYMPPGKAPESLPSL
jgi:hypothetical protein